MDYTRRMLVLILQVCNHPIQLVLGVLCVVSGLVQTHLYKPSIYELHKQRCTSTVSIWLAEFDERSEGQLLHGC